jgi:hypothetical protein
MEIKFLNSKWEGIRKYWNVLKMIKQDCGQDVNILNILNCKVNYLS